MDFDDSRRPNNSLYRKLENLRFWCTQNMAKTDDLEFGLYTHGRNSVNKDALNPRLQASFKRLVKLLRLKKDLKTLRGLKKNVGSKEPILPS